MTNQCPACGKSFESGQSVCACGAATVKAQSPMGVIAVVVAVGVLVFVLLVGVVFLGITAWRQMSDASRRATSASTTDSAAPTEAPAIVQDAPIPAPPVPQAPSTPLVVLPPATPVLKPAPPPAESEQSRLIAVLRSKDRKSRQSAAEALQARGWLPANAEQCALVLVAMDNPVAAERYAQAAVDPLCLMLDDEGRPEFNQMAAECLGRILDTRAVAPLCKALRGSQESNVRAAAATALGEIRSRAGMAALKQALARESDAPTKARIAEALQKLESVAGSDRLVAALTDYDASVQLRAAVLLLQQRDDATAAAWMERTLNGEDPTLRERAVTALSRIGGPHAIKILVARVGGSGSDGPGEALDALVQLGEPAIEPMVAALSQMDQNGRWRILIGLARLGAPAMRELASMLPTAPADLKKTACEVLGRLADHDDVAHKPVEPLIVLLSDADGDIRHSAAYALEQLKWEPPGPAERILLDKAKP
jgi:bilin biosynthesis protein